MSETLPLFPLGTVLFPGLLLPLHIFEDRYRRLVRDLQDGPEPRRFGVIAIRQGRETGVVGTSMIIDLSDRQALLAEPDALRRLIAERALLARELTMLRTLTATPAPDLRNSPYSSN